MPHLPRSRAVECLVGRQLAERVRDTVSTEGVCAGDDGRTATGRREVFECTVFRSPSGNVGCMIDTDYVRCDIGDHDWSPPPRPADCEFDYGQGISIAPGEPAQFVCAGDTSQAPDADPLPYDESITAGHMSCESAESGITCRDAESGNGFTISREAYRLF